MSGCQVTVAHRDTKPRMICSFTRLGGIGVGIVFLQQGYGFTGLAYSVVAGELLALVALALWLEAHRIARAR